MDFESLLLEEIVESPSKFLHCNEDKDNSVHISSSTSLISAKKRKISDCPRSFPKKAKTNPFHTNTASLKHQNISKKSSSKLPTISVHARKEQPSDAVMKIVSAPLRWQCQRLLQCCTGETRFCIMKEDENRVIFCRQLEEVIFVHSLGNRVRYVDKCKQLAFALKQNGLYLLQKYDPSQLVSLDNTLLAEGTIQETKRQEYQERVSACKRLLCNTDIFNDMHIPTAMAKCSWCKGDNITYKPLQTRGADEGMSIYCSCQSQGCGNNWTFRG